VAPVLWRPRSDRPPYERGAGLVAVRAIFVSACAVLAKLTGTGDSARRVAVGGSRELLARIDELVRVGVSKFVLDRSRSATST
jgi:hypothetical protein